MAYQHGKNLICDSCGHTVFLERIFFSHEPGKHEDPPIGWMNSPEFGDMCPVCAERFSRFVNSMFGDRTPEKWRNYI